MRTRARLLLGGDSCCSGTISAEAAPRSGGNMIQTPASAIDKLVWIVFLYSIYSDTNLIYKLCVLQYINIDFDAGQPIHIDR